MIESVADANIGSIMGIGFPGWTGGVLQYINGYEGGLPGFVARCRELAARYGERFEPPASLVERAERGELVQRRAGAGRGRLVRFRAQERLQPRWWHCVATTGELRYCLTLSSAAE